METAAGERSGIALPRATTVCRSCVQAVTVTGDREWGGAVHTATRRELGSDGHLVAPIGAGLVRAAMARKAGEGA
jgi:hypothetical protein